ncbi:MAG: hypothetical protein E7080_00590 [Bacteroidales bacterium]|nr:hypothetical protein [Bacteroidales bacterium]
MIKHEHIKNLYNKHKIELKTELDLKVLSKDSLKHHSIEFNNEFITIKSLEKESPFNEIPLKNVAGVEELPNHIAIVLRNSILFLSKQNNDIHVHINIEKPTLWERIKYLFNQ